MSDLPRYDLYVVHPEDEDPYLACERKPEGAWVRWADAQEALRAARGKLDAEMQRNRRLLESNDEMLRELEELRSRKGAQ